MRRRHLRSVLRIEAQVYPRPWSHSLFVSELALRSTRAYFIALPNADARRALSALSDRYAVGAEQRHRRGPYALSVYRLTPRAGDARGRGDPSP